MLITTWTFSHQFHPIFPSSHYKNCWKRSSKAVSASWSNPPHLSKKAGQTHHTYHILKSRWKLPCFTLQSTLPWLLPRYSSYTNLLITADVQLNLKYWIVKLFQVQQILEAISTAQEFAPQAIQYAQEYGPQAISAWQNYGPQAIQYAQEYGPQAIQYAQNYGPQAIQYAQEYGPQAIQVSCVEQWTYIIQYWLQAWQQYGNQLPEAISFAQQNAQYIPQVMKRKKWDVDVIRTRDRRELCWCWCENEIENDVGGEMMMNWFILFPGDPVLASDCSDNRQLGVDSKNICLRKEGFVWFSYTPEIFIKGKFILQCKFSLQLSISKCLKSRNKVNKFFQMLKSHNNRDKKAFRSTAVQHIFGVFHSQWMVQETWRTKRGNAISIPFSSHSRRRISCVCQLLVKHIVIF